MKNKKKNLWEGMGLQMEALLPVAAWLTEKYTSKESSSVTYETANMLMEAVIYCISEALSEKENAVRANQDIEPMLLYKKGYDIVLQKTGEAKRLYESIIKDFNAYGCKNYQDTILKGIPAFFIKYDPRFNPQNHILTLDYPLIAGYPDLEGVDMILTYLQGIEAEKRLLDCFERETVSKLLYHIQPEYRELYMDNICYPVLLNAVKCLIVDKPVQALVLTKEEEKAAAAYFDGMEKEKAENQIAGYIRIISGKIPGVGTYFNGMEKEYIVRISKAIFL